MLSRLPLRFPADLKDRAALARFRREQEASEPASRTVRTLCAWHGDEVVGALDVYWGGEGPLPRSLVDELGLAQAITGKGSPRSQVLFDAPVLRPDLAATQLDVELEHGAVRFAAQQGAPFVFSTCAPLDLSTWRALGYQPAGSPTPTRRLGFRIPVMLDLTAYTHLDQCASPFLALSRKLRSTITDEDELAAAEAEAEARWAGVQRLAEEAQAAHAAFLGALDAAGRKRLLEGGQLIEPDRGTVLVREGERGRELFLVLRGVAEARRDGRTIAVMGPGEVFGEVGFLLEARRTADVVAASDDVAVLKLTESALRALQRSEPSLAASVALGIARGLCFKLLATG